MTKQATRSLVCPVMIGRSEELATARAHLDGGTAAVLLVSGEAGVGKTRLVRETLAHAAAPDLRILQTCCFEADRSLPYAPVRDLLRALADLLPAADIARLAGPALSDLVRLVPELADSIGWPALEADPDAEKRRRFDVVVRLLRALAADWPLLVVVEDVHWSDDVGLEFLLHLARHTVGHRLSLLLTYRSEEVHSGLGHFLASLDRERMAAELPLARLAPTEVDAMLRAILGLARPAPASLVHAVVTLTDGNPFFVEEVLTALSATGPILAPDGAWQRRSGDELRIPRSVQDAVRRRVDLLGPVAREVLTLAAVAGRRFDFALLQDLTAHGEVGLVAVVKELIAARLVVEESVDRFAFRHALTRQAVYAELLERERRAHHRRVAEALERLHGGAPEAHLAELAYHSFEAATWEQALGYARRAAEQAVALYAPRAAIDHLTRALVAARHLALPPDPGLLRARGMAFETAGELARAQVDHEAALAAARTTGDRRAEWQALLDLGLLWAGRDYDQAGVHLRHALTLARDIGDPVLVARSLNRLGNWLVNVEQPREARRYHEEALAVFAALGDRHGSAETLDLLGLAHVLAGDLIAGAADYERAIAIWRILDDRRGLASSLVIAGACGANFHMGTVAPAVGPAEARRRSEEALAIARAIGWRAGEVWALWELGGLCDGATGAYERAFEATQAALAIAEEIGHRQWQVGSHCMLGNVYADLLAFPQARHHLERALDLARETASPYWIRSATGWLASAAVRQGELPVAERLLGPMLGPGFPMETIAARLLWCAQAELVLARGDPAAALDIADRLVAVPNATSNRPIARIEALRGEALAALDHVADAERALQTAARAAGAADARPLLWRIQLSLGRLWLGQGRRDDAARAFAAARSIVDDLAAAVPDDDLREGFVCDATALFPPAGSWAARRTEADAYGGLTAREREVAGLLTQGTSNRAIADALFLSEWTVATHVRNILAKLELSSRTQVATWAIEHGLDTRR